MIIVSFLPFWWRFWQCINKYYNTGYKAHLVNAGKYSSKLFPPLVVAIDANSSQAGGQYFEYFIIFYTIATLYCLVWDYYMDWGLFRSSEKNTYMLRPQIKYDRSFYYISMCTNCVLRFFWVIMVATSEWRDTTDYFGLLFFASIMAEAIRRT